MDMWLSLHFKGELKRTNLFSIRSNLMNTVVSIFGNLVNKIINGSHNQNACEILENTYHPLITQTYRCRWYEYPWHYESVLDNN